MAVYIFQLHNSILSPIYFPHTSDQIGVVGILYSYDKILRRMVKRDHVTNWIMPRSTG